MSTIKNATGWKGFLSLCLTAKNEKDLSSLLDLLLTHEEKEDFALRFLIIEELLKNKKTQREISKDLKVSIAKITRGSNALKSVLPRILSLLHKKNPK